VRSGQTKDRAPVSPWLPVHAACVLGVVAGVVAVQFAFQTWLAPEGCGPDSHVAGVMPVCVVPGAPAWVVVLAVLAGGIGFPRVTRWLIKRARR
jgi:hypothetical protein